MRIDGGCHCGAIRYTAEINPEQVSICHCTDCQTLSGTVFRTAVPVAKADLQLEGDTPRIYIKTTDEGARRAQAFCATCGTPIYASAEHDPQLFMVRVGTARQRAELVPHKQIWCRSALGWLDAIAGLPRIERQ